MDGWMMEGWGANGQDGKMMMMEDDPFMDGLRWEGHQNMADRRSWNIQIRSGLLCMDLDHSLNTY